MPHPRVRILFKVLGLAVLVVLIALAATASWAWWQAGRSLPQLAGERTVAGLSAEVTIDRDQLGVPDVRAQSADDLARALGFLHAQERFFQMDLARRRAAGELSELVGRAALPTDRAARLHRFRARATRVLAGESPEHLSLIAAYTDGVNTGLSALGTAPPEYLLLRHTPRPWVAEDSVLVVASMFFSLQDALGTGDARAGALRDALPLPLAEFLNSTNSDWDMPEHGAPFAALTPPDEEVFDLRVTPGSKTGGPADALAHRVIGTPPLELEAEADARGSNNWAVAGWRTTTGRAMVANDMHLGLGVPNIWYRASLTRPHNGRDLTVTGATLPGVPGMIVGSNGTIAWGFTNTTADWSDRVLLDVVGEGEDARYMTPDGPLPFEVTEEPIAIDGESPDTYVVRETIWGPVVGPDAQGRLHAVVWVAHFADGINLGLAALDTATTLDDAMVIANMAGIPAQNVVFADNTGGIAWTVGGRIPRREGFDGRYPESWADGTKRWNGWHSPSEYPRIVNPESGVIVTANNRIVSDTWLTMMGDGGYDPGGRARQIRDALLSIEKAAIADMLRIQLDDRALLMGRWRDLVLSVLGDSSSSPERGEFRRLIETTWTGHASIDSVGYRLVRQFRLTVAELAWAPFVARARTFDPSFPASPGRTLEGPVWALLTTQPPHLLDPKYANWSALMLDAVDQTIASLTSNNRVLADRTWGEANTLSATHPLSRAVPQLRTWLDLPRQPLPGDSHVPRFQSASSGASERFAVSPGHESDGYFHMPGGQSGHPRSRNYTDGHQAWVTGEPTPFMPGQSVTRLVLRP